MAGPMVAEAKRRQIVADWLDCGNYREVGRRNNLTDGAIRRQRLESPWWPELEEELIEQLRDATKVILGARFRRMIDLLGERLEVGDPYITKEGTVAYSPVRTRDLVLSMGITMDKLRLLEGKPQSLSATLDLNQLADQFRAIARGDSKLVAVQSQPGSGPDSDRG